MAHKYVSSASGDNTTGASWATAYTTLKAAAEAAGTAAGDNIWVAHDHAETQAAAVTITFKNSYTAPGTVMCVNRAGSVPPVAADLATTAAVTTTGAFSITLAPTGGLTHIYGITFSSGSGAVNNALVISANGGFNIKNCSCLKPGTTANASAITIGNFNLPGFYVLDNVSFGFGNVGDSLSVISGAGSLVWRNTPTPIVGAIIPTTVFMKAGYRNSVIFNGIDFSQLAAATPIYSLVDTNETIATLINCRLAASGTPFTPVTTPHQTGILINCASDATNYRLAKYRFEGALIDETIIVRTGGATDGTTPISWKIVTTANSKWFFPFESLPITIWNDTTGAKTVSIYGYWNNASAPNNDDIWIEVDALTNASFPISATASSGKTSFLATNAAIPTDSSTWGGGATTTKFKMSATMTAAMKGPITVRVKAAKASSTFYIDPKIEVV